MRGLLGVLALPALAVPAAALTPPPPRDFDALTLYFDADSVQPSVDGLNDLQVIYGDYLAQAGRIVVAGHTDSSASADASIALSERMAAAVRAELARLGVPASAIRTRAYGSARPAVAHNPGVRESLNRRVEVVYCARDCPQD